MSDSRAILFEADNARPERTLSASDKLRERLLQATIAHALTCSSFYAERLKGISAEKFFLESLPALPLLTKSDLNDRLWDLNTFDAYPDHLMYTSGTTGKPLEVPVLREEVEAYEELILSSYRRIYGADSDPLTLTIIRIGHGTHIFSGRIPSLPCHIQYGLSQFDDMIGREHRVNGRWLRPSVIDTNVLCLRQITRELLSLGRNPKELGVELLVVSGWYMPPSERIFFETAWGAPILERYGVTEVHGDGKRRPGSEDYIFDVTVIPEVVDPHSLLPIEEGVGLMVLTGLYPFNQAVPKIRYLVGDLVQVRRTDYLGGELGIRFLARQGDCITAPATSGVPFRLFSTDVADALEIFPDVARKSNTGFLKFRMLETEPHEGRIIVELTYLPSLFPERVSELMLRISALLDARSRFSGCSNIEISFVGPGGLDSITKL